MKYCNNKYIKILSIIMIASGIVGCGGGDGNDNNNVQPVPRVAEPVSLPKSIPTPTPPKSTPRSASAPTTTPKATSAQTQTAPSTPKPIEESALPDATQWIYYEENMGVDNKLQWTRYGGDLPNGLSAEFSDSVTYGVPNTTCGEYNFYVKGNDFRNNLQYNKKFTIKVRELEINGINKERLVDLYNEFKLYVYGTNKSGRYRDLGDNDLAVIFSQEGLDYSDFKNRVVSMQSTQSRSFNIFGSNDPKINKILHFVWVTDETDEEKVRGVFRKCNFSSDGRSNIETNAYKAKLWEKVLWTNNPKILPKDIIGNLEGNGVSIKSLKEIPALLEGAVNTQIISVEEGKKYNELLKLAYFYIKMHDYGSATDIIRYLTIFLYGGLYVDGDYTIYDIDKIEKLMLSNDSFFGVERGWDKRLGNAFLASKKHGKVIKGVLDLSFRNSMVFLSSENLSQSSVPDYIKYPYQWDMGLIFRTGPIALTIAFAKHKDEEQSKMLEYCSLFQIPRDDSGGPSCDKYPDKLGKHDFANNWNNKH